jgi:hypothetical protein
MPIGSVSQVVVRFEQRCACDANVARELRMPETTKSFGEIRRCGPGGGSELIAESAIAARRGSVINA